MHQTLETTPFVKKKTSKQTKKQTVTLLFSTTTPHILLMGKITPPPPNYAPLNTTTPLPNRIVGLGCLSNELTAL